MSHRGISRHCRRYRLLGQSRARLDTGPLRELVSSIAWCLDESTIQVRTVDVDGEIDGPIVTVGFPCQIVLNDVIPPVQEFLLNLSSHRMIGMA